MKRKLALMLVVATLSMGLFIGCSAPAEDTTTEETAVEETVVEEVEEEVAAEPVTYTDGIHEGVAEGFGGDIKVEVEVKDGKIVRVDILDHAESAGISDPAIEGTPAAMVESGTVDVEVTSGATYSSEGIINAVKNALETK